MPNLYGKNLFTRASKSSLVLGSNVSPSGEEGIDSAAYTRLGAEDGGICAGITLAWVAGFCNNHEGARDMAHFQEYFHVPLRFQGAYIQDFMMSCPANPYHFMQQLDLFKTNLACINFGRYSPFDLLQKFPESPMWAAFVAIPAHNIGIGKIEETFYIMEPNAGLYEYNDQYTFSLDFGEIIFALMSFLHILSDSCYVYFLTTK